MIITWAVGMCVSTILKRDLEKASSLKMHLKIAYQLDAFHRAHKGKTVASPSQKLF